MKKSLLYFLLLTFLAYPSLASAEKFNLTSYYPAPVGNYKNIRLSPRTALPSTNCNLGTLYVNSSDHLPYFCAPDPLSSIPTFATLGGPWSLSGNSLYLTDTSAPANKMIGIGTTSPTFKLTLANDGGILSNGAASTSSDLPNPSIGTQLIWYPKKGAFRVGYNAMIAGSTTWDDANIGTNSISMGYINRATSPGATIWGGQNNIAEITTPPSLADTNAIDPGSVIAGGKNNTSHGSLDQILGGENNSATDFTVISGANNTGINYAVIGGGQGNDITGTTYASTIGGGWNNRTTATDSTISGGVSNISAAGGDYNTISGGFSNNLTSSTSHSTIAGGNTNYSDSPYTTIGGGDRNYIWANSAYSTISGGLTNVTYGQYTTVSGGNGNGTGAGDPIAPYGSVAGGWLNLVQDNSPTVIGGEEGYAFGDHSVVVGGLSNITLGAYSLTGGYQMRLSASASHDFVWGYSEPAIPDITVTDAFIIYNKKMGIRDIAPAALLEINGNGSTDDYLNLTSTPAASHGDVLTVKNNGFIGVGQTSPTKPMQFGNGAYVSATGNFMNASSRELKDNISELSTDQAIAAFSKLTPVQYNYKNEKDHRYLGFIAEDVPDLVADKTRKGLSPMDIAAVLTKVIAHQQDTINEQKKTRQMLLREIAELKEKITK